MVYTKCVLTLIGLQGKDLSEMPDLAHATATTTALAPATETTTVFPKPDYGRLTSDLCCLLFLSCPFMVFVQIL